MGRRLSGETVAEKLKFNQRIEGDCWRWTGAHTPEGYGQLAVDRKRRAVHRLAYVLWTGPIPAGLEIDHLCRVRDCINPNHLEAVTHGENLRRSVRAPRALQISCKRGHALGPDNVYVHRNGGRECRACKRARLRAYKARRRARSNA